MQIRKRYVQLCINAVEDGLSRKVCSGEFGELADYGQGRRDGWGYLGGSFLIIFFAFSAYSKVETPSFMFMLTPTIT